MNKFKKNNNHNIKNRVKPRWHVTTTEYEKS